MYNLKWDHVFAFLLAFATTVRRLTGMDYCTLETFNPKCKNFNEVILITTATYGRMEVGKCITHEEVSGLLGQDPKYFGCNIDVLSILHAKCSAKTNCEVKIPDAALDKTKPCFPGLKTYLRAEYICINIVDNDTTCHIQASPSTSKYLTMKGLLNNTGCGSVHRPWIFEATRGQKIRTTFVKTRVNMHANEEHSQLNCKFEIGSFVENSQEGFINRTFCSTGFFQHKLSVPLTERIEDKFISSGSTVKLFVKADIIQHFKSDKDVDGMVLLKIDADGCLDIIPPEDTWLKRTGDDIVIGCYSSKQTWYLRCENKKWSGTIGNCSAMQSNNHNIFQYNKNGESAASKIMGKENQILLIVVICGVGLVFCSVIICTGAVCLKRFTKKEIVNGLYDNQQMYQGGQNSLYKKSLIKINSSTKNGFSQNNEFTSAPSADLMNNENKYFVLERDEYPK